MFNSILRYGILSQAVSGATPFSPDQISGLLGWWGNDVNSGVDRTTLSNGTAITQWDDQSGNGYHWYQDSMDIPIYSASTDSIYFDGSNDGLRNLMRIGWSGATVFYVSTINRSITAYQISNVWDRYGIYNSNVLTFISRYDNGGTQGLEWFGGDYLPRLSYGTPAELGNNFHLFYGDYIAGDTSKIYLDGNYISSGTTDNSINDSINVWQIIGTSRYITAAPFSDFACKELIFYNRKLNDSERIQVETWLNNKYSIY